MFATALIIFREILEIAVIVGVVMAATKGLKGRLLLLTLGLSMGILGASIIAVFTDAISQAVDGMGQEVFNAMIMFSAVIMLCWTAIWMRKHGRELTQHLRQVGADVVSGNKSIYTLLVVIAVSTFREGSEIVLFIYGMLSSGNLQVAEVITGSLIGLVSGIMVGLMLYYGLMKAARKQLFAVTGWMLIILASGMASQGVNFLISANLLPSLKPEVWDSSAILETNSILGKVLQTLIGYNAHPNGMELLVYLSVLVVVGSAYKYMGRSKPQLPAQKTAINNA